MGCSHVRQNRLKEKKRAQGILTSSVSMNLVECPMNYRTILMGLIVIISSMLSLTAAGATMVQAVRLSACPDPGHCTYNPATGVMTDHEMEPPFNRINNGYTETGPF